MVITYRDALGYVEVKADSCNIGFVDGYAYFSSDEKDCRIAIHDIVCISKADE